MPAATSAASAALGPGQHLDLEPGRHARLHEHEARVADERHPGVADQRDDRARAHPLAPAAAPRAARRARRSARARPTRRSGRAAPSCVRVSSQAMTSASRSAREHAQRDVLEVADRRRADDEAVRSSASAPTPAPASSAMHGRAEHPRLGAEARRHDPHVVARRSAARAPRRPRAPGAEQQLAGGDRAAADDDDLGVEDVDQRRRSPRPEAPAHQPRSRRSAAGSPSWASSVTSAPVIVAPRGQRAPERAVGRLARHAAAPSRADRVPGHERLQAAVVRAAARARRPVGVDDDVAELGRRAARAVDERARRRCSPPPMPVPSVSMIASLRPARRAAAPLGEHRRVGVVVDDDRQPEALGQQVAHARRRAAAGGWSRARRRVAGSTRHGMPRPTAEDLAGRRLDGLLAPPRRAGRSSAPASSGRARR